jgi:hypothetical protein
MLKALIVAAVVAASPSPTPAPKATQAPFTFVIQDSRGKPVLFIPRCNKTQIKADLSNVGDLMEQCGAYFPGSIDVAIGEKGKAEFYTLTQARVLVHGIK